MGNSTGIEWTATRHADGSVTPGSTWNPIRGCSRVSKGCENCYAESVAHRFGGAGQPYEGLTVLGSNGPRWNGEVRFIEDHLFDPLRWQKPRRIFVNSMSDLFHENIPDEWINRIFAVMASAPQHTFQILTKRPERMRRYLQHPDISARIAHAAAVICSSRPPVTVMSDEFPGRTAKVRMFDFKNGGVTRSVWQTPNMHWWPLRNVWLGVSTEDQKTADERIPLLLQTPAAVRFISAEPLLGPIDINLAMYGEKEPWPSFFGFTDGCGYEVRLRWIIAGGESGHGARPTHPDWVRSLRDQCVAANVPYFFKQWGEWLPGEKTPDSGTGYRRCDTGEIYSTIGNPARQNFGTDPDAHSGSMITRRVGKKVAGRLLDGREWNEMPEPTP